MKVYKIRDRNTGLFSTGGVSPSWTKLGKTWNSEGALKNHLTLLQEYSNYEDSWTFKKTKKKAWCCPESWDVVVLVCELTESFTYSAQAVSKRASKK